MTTSSASPNLSASRGFGLIVPAYKAAYASVKILWPLLTLGAVFVAATAFFPDPLFEQQPSGLSALDIALRIGAILALIGVGLFIYAKAWTICFTPHPLQDQPKSFFSLEYKAVLSTVIQVFLRTLWIAILPCLALVGLITLVGLISNINLMDIPFLSAVLSTIFVLIVEAVAARYILAVPNAIVGARTGSSEPKLLSSAWCHIKTRYLIVLAAILPIMILSEIAYNIVDIVAKLIFEDQSHFGVLLLTYTAAYIVFVITLLAAMQVAIRMWSETEQQIND